MLCHAFDVCALLFVAMTLEAGALLQVFWQEYFAGLAFDQHMRVSEERAESHHASVHELERTRTFQQTIRPVFLHVAGMRGAVLTVDHKGSTH